MKATSLALLLFLALSGLQAQPPQPPGMPTALSPAERALLRERLRSAGGGSQPGASTAMNPASSANPGAGFTAPPNTATQAGSASANPAAAEVAAYSFTYDGVDVNQVLDVYADLVGRTLIRGSIPNASIVLKTQAPLTKSEAIEALQAVLAMNNISVVNIGDKFAKVGSSSDAGSFGQSIANIPESELPDLGTYVTHICQLNYVKPSAVVPIITPLARLKDIIPLDDNGILVIRDYAENVKRMLEMIARIDVNVPQEYISEVIPILYAQADDIANALNSLGGSGSATVTFGQQTTGSSVNGLANRPAGSGFGGMSGSSYSSGGIGGINQPQGTINGQTTPNGTPSSGTSFQDRLRQIIQRASSPAGGAGGAGGQGGQQQIQVFGQAKIIADERSNSLLVFATRADMERIKHVISQLDVLLSQVLIESAIIDYELGPNTFNFGVSAAQSPQNYAPGVPVIGGGGVNNGSNPGSTFLNFLTSAYTGNAVSNTVFGNNLPGGLSYFGNIGPNWNVALTAAAADSHASIVQRPRIQTSQAKPAQFFVGETVPYVTGSTYGSAYGNSSSYSQLSVGVELDVTPFINPNGLVVMDINQEIDDINGFTAITGVGNVPNTDKRTLSSEVAVKDGDTVMLGGFIRADKSTARSGVPLLMNIPLIGNLFTSRSDSKDRTELIVLIRPTVLRTPDAAAEQAVSEQKRLPGITETEREDEADQRAEAKAQQKEDARQAHLRDRELFPSPTNPPDVIFTPVAPNAPPVPGYTNNAAPAH